MKWEAFAVYDSAVEAYTKPFFEQTIGSAVRAFTDGVNQEGSMFSRHAKDYTLFHVGSFDERTGMFDKITPVSMGNALQYLEQAQVIDIPKEA